LEDKDGILPKYVKKAEFHSHLSAWATRVYIVKQIKSVFVILESVDVCPHFFFCVLDRENINGVYVATVNHDSSGMEVHNN
jgi:hypothetical protein